MAHAVECFYMGPNDTTVPEQVEYALGSKDADAIIVAGAFLGDDGVKETELRQRMMSGYYKLTNRTTNDTGILMIQEMIDKANEEIDSLSAATTAVACDEWKSPIFFCLAARDTFDDPYILRRFGGVTYAWSEKHQWWCRAGGMPA